MTRIEQAAAALLALALAWTIRDVSRIGEDHPDAAPAKAVARSRQAAALPDDAYANIVSRSLFVPARRADFASASRNPNVVGGHVLRGVLLGETVEIALFEPLSGGGGGGGGRRLRVDSMIGGYRITAIDDAGVELERDGRRRHVDIDDGPVAVELARQTGVTSPMESPAAMPPAPFEPTPDEIEQ